MPRVIRVTVGRAALVRALGRTRSRLFWTVCLLLAAPLELGSESLTLTAPFPPAAALYNRLVTTGSGGQATIFSRDAGATIIAPSGTNPTGKLGIGTSSPGADFTLDVAGNVRAVAGYRVSGGNLHLGTGFTPRLHGGGGTLYSQAAGDFRIEPVGGGTPYAQFGPTAAPGGVSGGQINGDLTIPDGQGHLAICSWSTYSGGAAASACSSGIPIYIDNDFSFADGNGNGIDDDVNYSCGTFHMPPRIPVDGRALCCRFSP